jgi:NAD/NADP transhydrogenase beta subunit
MNKFAIIKEFLAFLRERKKWWLMPIVLFLLVLGALLVFAQGSALAPFIYSLF